MTDRQFNAALDAYHDRLFSDMYDVADELEDIDNWIVIEDCRPLGGLDRCWGWSVLAPARSNSDLFYFYVNEWEARRIARALNARHPNYGGGPIDIEAIEELEGL